MANKKGLGKGLEALLSSNVITEAPEEEKVKEGEQILNLKLIDVEPNRNQARKHFDEEALEELATSIKQYGVIQPIIVTKQDGFYQIAAGERRWRACKKAGMKEIPAIVRNYDEQTNSEISLIENIQREDLNPIEKARAIRELLDRYNITQQKLSETLGMGRSTLTNIVRLLNLDPRVIVLVQEGKIGEGHCKALLTIADGDKQYRAALRIIEAGDTVREVEKQMGITRRQEDTSRYEAVYRDIEEAFRNFFGAKVKVDGKKRSGKIIISYSSSEELSRLLEIIGAK